jgi:hypothetical protein
MGRPRRRCVAGSSGLIAEGRKSTDVATMQVSDELEVLRAFRNVGLAHRADPNLPDPRSKSKTRRVLHGDDRIVLETTVELLERLRTLLGVVVDPTTTKESSRNAWKKRAKAFWAALSPPVSQG